MIAVWCAKCNQRVEKFAATAVGIRAWHHGETEYSEELRDIVVNNKSKLVTTTMFKGPEVPGSEQVHPFKEQKQPLTDAPGRGKITETGGW